MRIDGKKWIAENQGKHFCHCGCNEPIEIKIHHHARGVSKYIDGHYSRISNPMSGKNREQNPRWKGGKTINSCGYVEVYVGTAGGRAEYKREHIIVMEKRIGRKLFSDEDVHHIDGDKKNNAIDNLALMTKSGHSMLHVILLKTQLGREKWMESRRLMRERKPYRHALSDRM